MTPCAGEVNTVIGRLGHTTAPFNPLLVHESRICPDAALPLHAREHLQEHHLLPVIPAGSSVADRHLQRLGGDIVRHYVCTERRATEDSGR